MGKLQKSIINPKQSDQGYVFASPHRQKYLSLCVPLHKAALKGDWDAAEELLAKDSSLITSPITEGKEIALHIAALGGHYSFVAKLLANMEKKDLEISNAKGSTALCLVAATGNVDIAKLMVKKNACLPGIKGTGNGITPLYMAALQSHTEMAEYLYPLSDFQSWTLEDQTTLLTTLIDSDMYGLAMRIVEQYRRLAIAEDCNGETALQVLARKPLAFSCSTRQGLWSNISKTILPLYQKKKKTHNVDGYTLFGCLWESAVCQDDTEMRQNGNLSRLLFLAADSENEEFLIELIGRYPDLLYKVNEMKHSIFHIAVLRRYSKVYNLLYELGGVKDLIATYIDEDGNNILHLAAKLAPQNQLNTIPGVALQLQTEILWYKEVEKFVRASYRRKKNIAGQTPYDLFLAEHQHLMREGEKLMKQTALSCMLVTILVAIVVFATVPENDKKFPISEAVATLSSLTSMLMFVSILAASPHDFVKCQLPFCLLIAVASFFITIVAMSLLLFQHAELPIFLLFVFFSSAPLMFVILKFPLLVTILRCRCFFRSNH